jgi:hypothetical protein
MLGYLCLVHICACTERAARHVLHSRLADALRALQTYGMLIYRLLGDEAQQSFARSWGISYGINAAQEARPASRLRLHLTDSALTSALTSALALD